jgi:hypothetical protein
MEKFAAQAIKHKIDRILWEIWDPIAVNQLSSADDEYSRYVDGVFELLVKGASDDAISQHLLSIAVTTMGLTGVTLEQMHPTVVALRAITLEL